MNLFIVAFWCVQVCVCICVHACVCVCVCLYVCVCACLHVCVFEGNFCCHPIFVCFLSFFFKTQKIEEEESTGYIRFEKFLPMMTKVLMERRYGPDSSDQTNGERPMCENILFNDILTLFHCLRLFVLIRVMSSG